MRGDPRPINIFMANLSGDGEIQQKVSIFPLNMKEARNWFVS